MNPVAFTVVTGLHDLFTAIWIGGMIVTLISILPSLRSVLGNDPQTKKVIAAFQKRQSKWVYISMVGLAVTGIILSKNDAQFARLFRFTNPYSVALSIKHILIVLLVALTLYRSLALDRKGTANGPKKEKIRILLLIINVILGVLILFASGAVAALSSPM